MGWRSVHIGDSEIAGPWPSVADDDGGGSVCAPGREAPPVATLRRWQEGVRMDDVGVANGDGDEDVPAP